MLALYQLNAMAARWQADPKASAAELARSHGSSRPDLIGHGRPTVAPPLSLTRWSTRWMDYTIGVTSPGESARRTSSGKARQEWPEEPGRVGMRGPIPEVTTERHARRRALFQIPS